MKHILLSIIALSLTNAWAGKEKASSAMKDEAEEAAENHPMQAPPEERSVFIDGVNFFLSRGSLSTGTSDDPYSKLEINDDRLTHLAQRSEDWSRNCEALAMHGSRSYQITHEGMRCFSSIILSNLTHLYITDNNIGPLGTKYLTRTKMPQLRVLNLRENRINREGAHHLSKGVFPHLCSLILDDNRLKETEYLIKLNCPHLFCFSLGFRKEHEPSSNAFSQEECLQLCLMELSPRIMDIPYFSLEANVPPENQAGRQRLKKCYDKRGIKTVTLS